MPKPRPIRNSPADRLTRTRRPRLPRWRTCLALLGAGILAIAGTGCRKREAPQITGIHLLAAAGMQPALDELLPAFAVASGSVVNAEYAGSGLILTRAREPKAADLFLPGDTYYVKELQRQTGRVAEFADIAYLIPCILVSRGNPHRIESVQDLRRDGLRVGLGNPETCQVGRTAETLLRLAGIDPADLKPKYSLTANELGLWVQMGDVDAAVAWDATAVAQGGRIEAIALPINGALVSQVSVAVLADAQDPEAARQFLRFCTGPRARGILRRKGYCVDPPGKPAAANSQPGDQG